MGSAIATVTDLPMGAIPAPKNNGTGGLHGTLEGAYPWPFGRDPNSSFLRRDVESEPTDREHLGYVCNPRSLKEGTETSRPVATAPVPPLSGRAPARLLSENLNMRCTCCLLYSRCDQRQLDAIIACQCALARLVYTRSG